MYQSISVSEAHDKFLSGIPIIDVRTPAEFQSQRAAGAINMPLDTLDIGDIRKQFGDNQIMFICQAGVRSANACKKIAAEGIKNLLNIEGGTTAWAAANLPTDAG